MREPKIGKAGFRTDRFCEGAEQAYLVQHES